MRRAMGPVIAVFTAVLVVVGVAIALVVGFGAPVAPEAEAPGAAALLALDEITDTRARKTAFFGLIQPLIERENARVLDQRRRLQALRDALASGGRLSAAQRGWLFELARRYRLDAPLETPSTPVLDELLARVDAVPQRLVLIQAAKESGWGRSRLSRQGNNIFGQWCFEPGCGIVPARRAAGATHEVAVFDDLGAAVRAYLHNLNTNGFYADLRLLRQDRRTADAPVTAESLLPGLLFYSERRQAYLDDLATMLRQNDALLPPRGRLADAGA